MPTQRILENVRVVPGTLPLISLLLTANGLVVHLVSKEKLFRNYFGSKIPRLVPRRRITQYNPSIFESAVYGGSSIKVYGACQTT